MSTTVTNCDLEPIQYLGCIQPNGFLLGVNLENFTVAYVSENIAQISGLAPAFFLNNSWEQLQAFCSNEKCDTGFWKAFEKAIKLIPARKGYEIDIAVIYNQEYYVVTHVHEGIFIIEFEIKYLKPGIIPNVYAIHASLLHAKDVDETLQIAADEIRQLTGYERVLVYRFLKDGSGEVVAESSVDDSVAYMGLHFPESDIPKQARRLYTINKVRIITDAHSKDVKLMSKLRQPLDLTHSVLRSVSQTHIQYLRNMGVRSSFSISIVQDDKLWGLIACHNATRLPVDYQVRESVKIIADVLGNAVEMQGKLSSASFAARNEKKFTQLYKLLATAEGIGKALLQGEPNILELIKADGVAVYVSDVLSKKGICPSDNFIKKITSHCIKLEQKVLETTKLYDLFPEEEATRICGVLVCKIGLGNDMLLWFRQEYRHDIFWAGEPVKIYEDVKIDGVEFQKINPRTSFESWKESIKNHSAPWLREEIDAVENLSKIIVESSFRRNALLEANNKKLQLAYSEVDNFMNSISHDISSPLTVISLTVEMMLRRLKDDDSAMKESLLSIKGQSSRISNMLLQIKEMSRISNKNTQVSEIEMLPLVTEILDNLQVKYAASNPQKIVGTLYNIQGNEIALYQIFLNILGNAFKYSSRKKSPVVSIKSFNEEDAVIYHIYDNGIGVSPGDDIFKAFTRSEGASDYEGTGIGLSIVKNLVARQNATIRYCSSLGEGTCFYLTFFKS